MVEIRKLYILNCIVMALTQEFVLFFKVEFSRFISTCIEYIDKWKSITIDEVYEAVDRYSIIELIEDKLWEDWSFLWADMREAINAMLCHADITHKTIRNNPKNGLLLIVEVWFWASNNFCGREYYIEEAIEHKRSNS